MELNGMFEGFKARIDKYNVQTSSNTSFSWSMTTPSHKERLATASMAFWISAEATTP
jgi:hypothetical protein